MSVGSVNRILASLVDLGYVREYEVTESGLAILEPYRVKRAVFLTAGFGSRLRPLTLKTPKPLICVNGVRIIDTLLDAVIAAGIITLADMLMTLMIPSVRGALGIFLGPFLAARSVHAGQLFPALCLLCALLLLLLRQSESRTEALRLPQSPQSRGTFLRITVCMFLTVLLRAYMGSLVRYPFQSTFLMALLFVLCILAGKFLGGRFADRFGAFSFSLVAQLAATALFVLSLWYPYCAYPAIFLFNTTMAITAHRLYRLSPAYGGAMFGLTTLALYLGTLPKLLGWASPLFTWWGLLLLGLLSTALLLVGLLPKGGDADA